MTAEQSPVPYESRWLVWMDQSSYGQYQSQHAARWFWAASGPRGHASGAEDEADEACQRALIAAASLESSMRKKAK